LTESDRKIDSVLQFAGSFSKKKPNNWNVSQQMKFHTIS